MNLFDFLPVMRHLDVANHREKISRNRWDNAEYHNAIPGFSQVFEDLFDGNPEIYISRGELLDQNNHCDIAFLLKILMWGYPSGGIGHHGNTVHVRNILNERENINRILNLATTLNHDQIVELRAIPSLGLSTLSKVLYFTRKNFDKYPCLIFDSKIRRILNAHYFEDIQVGPVLHEEDPPIADYQRYLEIIHSFCGTHHISPAKVELFLFLMANLIPNEG